MSLERHVIEVHGRVQGVGFRPHVAREAMRLGLDGSVANVADGVRIDVQGAPDRLQAFARAIDERAPPRAGIEAMRCSVHVPEAQVAEAPFHIAPSVGSGSAVSIAHDGAPCDTCLAELFDPANLRHRYPFISCTDCGPRYAILRGTPWDRANTTMAGFELCARCRWEVDSPTDRRCHAQTQACADCGPRLELLDAAGRSIGLREAALAGARAVLAGGGILALKGLGGFQLLCDAGDVDAVQRLRVRKRRLDKPFAVMLPSLDVVCEQADPTPLEASWLASPAAPIVLLRRRADATNAWPIAVQVAPASPLLGLMLPATPLHHLLVNDLGRALVTTSGNLAGEPMAIGTADAVERLSGIADAWLTHDRPIARALDDSLLREIAGERMVLRRGRGLAPLSFGLSSGGATVLALGGDGKAALCLVEGDTALLGEHLGDIASPRSRERLTAALDDVRHVHQSEPDALAIDAHPDYATARLGLRLGEVQGLPVHRVPHHLAHVLAVAAEHRLDGPLLGIAWDGAGFGDDAEVRGSECLTVDGTQVRRIATLLPFRLPGGDAAAREPRRAALGLLHTVFGEALFADGAQPQPQPSLGLARRWLRTAFADHELAVLARMLADGIRAPWSSSAGRLFDGLAALLDLASVTSFEGQAAQRLEHAADGDAMFSNAAMVPDLRCEWLPRPSYGDPRDASPAASAGEIMSIDWRPMLTGALSARADDMPVAAIARAVHDALVAAIVTTARHAGLRRVLLGGGCFQNRRLAEGALAALKAAEFEPYIAREVPPNDGGLALGQAIWTRRASAASEGRGENTCV